MVTALQPLLCLGVMHMLEKCELHQSHDEYVQICVLLVIKYPCLLQNGQTQKGQSVGVFFIKVYQVVDHFPSSLSSSTTGFAVGEQ